DFEPRYKLASVYRRLERTAEAEIQTSRFEHLQRCRQEFARLHEEAFADMKNADLRYQLGKIACELYRFDLAQVWFEASLAINPQHVLAHQALAALQQR